MSLSTCPTCGAACSSCYAAEQIAKRKACEHVTKILVSRTTYSNGLDYYRCVDCDRQIAGLPGLPFSKVTP